MAKHDISGFIKFDELTPEEKRDLQKRFQERRRVLEEALRVVNRGLKALAKAKKTSKKRRTAKRRTKG
jgi:hypothetical protein